MEILRSEKRLLLAELEAMKAKYLAEEHDKVPLRDSVKE